MNMLDESLVPSYNRSQPRFMGVLRLLASLCNGANTVLESILNTNLDTSVGTDLDAIGALVGADRVLPFSPLSGPRVLSDKDYRMLIRARIAMNNWDGTNETAAEMFSTILPSFGVKMEDRQNCSVQITLTGSTGIEGIQLEMLNQGMLIPVPAGVKYEYVIPQEITTSTVIVRSGVYETGEFKFRSVSEDNIYKCWTDTDGFVLQSYGILEANADYVTTDFIPVHSNTIYADVEKSPSDGGIRFGFYDSEKTFIRRWVADASHPGLITTASGDGTAFVRLSYRKDGVIRSISTGALPTET